MYASRQLNHKTLIICHCHRRTSHMCASVKRWLCCVYPFYSIISIWQKRFPLLIAGFLENSETVAGHIVDDLRHIGLIKYHPFSFSFTFKSTRIISFQHFPSPPLHSIPFVQWAGNRNSFPVPVAASTTLNMLASPSEYTLSQSNNVANVFWSVLMHFISFYISGSCWPPNRAKPCKWCSYMCLSTALRFANYSNGHKSVSRLRRCERRTPNGHTLI